MNNPNVTVRLREWHAETSHSVGGFSIHITVSGQTATQEGPSYRNRAERADGLRTTRPMAQVFADGLGVELQEELLEKFPEP